MTPYREEKFPKSRIATIDVCELSSRKHHVTGMLEIDVTEAREKIKRYKREKGRISFTAWLISTISHTISDYESIAAFLKGSRKVLIFDDVNVSIVVEKKISGTRVPLPLIIEKADKRSIESITEQISKAQEEELNENDIVISGKSTRLERLYYSLPGFLRRVAWRYMLKRPKLVYGKMGNVAITALGMMGTINGWFIPRSIHPVCFGIGSVIKKPIVIDDRIEIREMLNMTILIDHDVIDGAPMARFINDLTKNIKQGLGLQ